MATLTDLANQVLGGDNRPGVRTVINDRSLSVQNASVGPSVFLFGTTNNIRVTAEGTRAVNVNEPIAIAQGSLADIFLNHSSNGRPSELRLMYEAAVNGGATNISVVCITKTVATLAANITDSATTIPVDTGLGNEFTTVNIPTPSIPVWGASLAQVGDYLFLMGGVNADGDTVHDIQIYDIEAGTWSVSATTLPDPTAVSDGTAGDPTATSAYSQVGSEEGAAHMATYVDHDNSAGAGATTAAIYLIGGSTYAAGSESATDFGCRISVDLSGASPALTATQAMLEDGSGSVAMSHVGLVFDRLSSGTAGSRAFYVIGGWCEAAFTTDIRATGQLTQVWEFTNGDIATNVCDMDDTDWDLATGRAGAMCYYDDAVVGSEQVVICGGEASTGVLNTIETIAITSGSILSGSTSVATLSSLELPGARAYGTAVRVNGSDQVWLIGGTSNAAAIASRTTVASVDKIDTGATTPAWYRDPEYAVPGSAWHSAVVTQTTAANRRPYVVSGAVVSSGSLVPTSTTPYGFRLNLGLGNLDDPVIGFTTIDGATVTSITIQIDGELITVSGYGISRDANGVEHDSFTVSARGALGSTAASHLKYSDVYEGQSELYADLEDSLTGLSSIAMDNVVVPWRAYADSPYLPVGTNFAWMLAYVCWIKGRDTGRVSIGYISMLPPWTDFRTLPATATLNTWADTANNFNRTNNSSQNIWGIADGVTDANLDDIPDTYAFWATDDGTIPTTVPPANSNKVVKDERDNPIDIGKYIIVCAYFGNAFNALELRKYGEGALTANRVLKMGHVHYAGQVSAIVPPSGTTGQAVAGLGYAGVSPDASKLNTMLRNRYTIASQRNGVFTIGDGVTFGFYISNNVRTDFTQLSTFRVLGAVINALVGIGQAYIGRPIGATTPAMKAEMEEALNVFQQNGQIQSSTLEIKASPAQENIGEEQIDLEVRPFFERRRVLINGSLNNGFTVVTEPQSA